MICDLIQSSLKLIFQEFFKGLKVFLFACFIKDMKNQVTSTF